MHFGFPTNFIASYTVISQNITFITYRTDILWYGFRCLNTFSLVGDFVANIIVTVHKQWSIWDCIRCIKMMKAFCNLNNPFVGKVFLSWILTIAKLYYKCLIFKSIVIYGTAWLSWRHNDYTLPCDDTTYALLNIIHGLSSRPLRIPLSFPLEVQCYDTFISSRWMKYIISESPPHVNMMLYFMRCSKPSTIFAAVTAKHIKADTHGRRFAPDNFKCISWMFRDSNFTIVSLWVQVTTVEH